MSARETSTHEQRRTAANGLAAGLALGALVGGVAPLLCSLAAIGLATYGFWPFLVAPPQGIAASGVDDPVEGEPPAWCGIPCRRYWTPVAVGCLAMLPVLLLAVVAWKSLGVSPHTDVLADAFRSLPLCELQGWAGAGPPWGWYVIEGVVASALAVQAGVELWALATLIGCDGCTTRARVRYLVRTVVACAALVPTALFAMIVFALRQFICGG
jgi:hypothetical protein